MINNKIIFIDIDGVIADFQSHFYNYLDLPKHKAVIWDDERIMNNFHLIANDENFWMTIKRINTINLDFIDGYCTARSIDGYITKKWLLKNGFPDRKVITVGFNNSKVNALANVDYFLDDSPRNFTELNEADINTYLLDREYNRNIKTNKRVKNIKEFKDEIINNRT
jgi:uncharacterized HAD superfamily protein